MIAARYIKEGIPTLYVFLICFGLLLIFAFSGFWILSIVGGIVAGLLSRSFKDTSLSTIAATIFAYSIYLASAYLRPGGDELLNIVGSIAGLGGFGLFALAEIFSILIVLFAGSFSYFFKKAIYGGDGS